VKLADTAQNKKELVALCYILNHTYGEYLNDVAQLKDKDGDITGDYFMTGEDRLTLTCRTNNPRSDRVVDLATVTNRDGSPLKYSPSFEVVA